MTMKALVTQDDLSEWLGYKQRADIERVLKEHRIKYIVGRGGRIATTIDKINEAMSTSATAVTEIEFEDGPQPHH